MSLMMRHLSLVAVFIFVLSGINSAPAVATVEQPQAEASTPPTDSADVNLGIQQKLMWLTGLLVVVGVVTAAVIAWQSYETRKSAIAGKQAAEAAQANIEALINSERAWILVQIGPIPFFENPNRLEFLDLKPIIKNFGGTPARVTKILAKRHELKTVESLPEDPDYTGDGVYVAAIDFILPPDQRVQPITVKIPLSDLAPEYNGHVYLYGFVQYLDTIQNIQRESRFCYLWFNPSGFTTDVKGFYLAGSTPPAYTKCT
jgi:hypothetical protein